MHKVRSAVIRWREPWDLEVALRAARFLGLTPTRVRTGGSRWKKETHVRGAEDAVQRWRELVAAHASAAGEAAGSAWRAYVDAQFPEEPEAPAQVETEELA